MNKNRVNASIKTITGSLTFLCRLMGTDIDDTNGFHRRFMLLSKPFPKLKHLTF